MATRSRSHRSDFAQPMIHVWLARCNHCLPCTGKTAPRGGMGHYQPMPANPVAVSQPKPLTLFSSV